MTDRLVIDLGGRTAELRHIAPGNTKGDMFLWLPEERILATGDIVVRPTPYGFYSYPAQLGPCAARIEDLRREIHRARARRAHDRHVVPGPAGGDDGSRGGPGRRGGEGGKSLDETRAALDWSPVEKRFTGDDGMLPFLFNIWFKTPIVEAQYNLSSGKDNESLEAPETPQS